MASLLRITPQLNRKLQLAMWLALIGAPVAIAYGSYEYYRTHQLQNEGERIEATVVGSQALDTGQGRTSYLLMLQYEPAGQDAIYRKQFVVSETLYDEAKQAGKAKVIYSPKDPTEAVVGDSLPVKTEPFAIGGGLFLFALMVWYYRRKQAENIGNLASR